MSSLERQNDKCINKDTLFIEKHVNADANIKSQQKMESRKITDSQTQGLRELALGPGQITPRAPLSHWQ